MAARRAKANVSAFRRAGASGAMRTVGEDRAAEPVRHDQAGTLRQDCVEGKLGATAK